MVAEHALAVEPVHQLLRQLTPADDQEAVFRIEMLRFLHALKQPFSRAEPIAHFTASAFITDPSAQQVVLIHHHKLQRWLQPGGHFEEEDQANPLQAALREAREETGLAVWPCSDSAGILDLDIHRIPARGADASHLHLDLRFWLLADVGPTQAQPGESNAVAWLPLADAQAQVGEAGFARMVTKVNHARAQGLHPEALSAKVSP